MPEAATSPCPISERQAKTLRELAILATEHLDSALCANGKLEVVGQIVAEANALAQP